MLFSTKLMTLRRDTDSQGAIRSPLFFSVSPKEDGYLIGSGNDFFHVLNARINFTSQGIPSLLSVALLRVDK